MEAEYQIIIHAVAAKEDWPRLPKAVQERVGKSIMSKLTTRPEVYGKPLRQSLKNNYKLRVGDYRVVYRIKGKTVIIWAIDHRAIIYAKAIKRLTAEF